MEGANVNQFVNLESLDYANGILWSIVVFNTEDAHRLQYEEFGCSEERARWLSNLFDDES